MEYNTFQNRIPLLAVEDNPEWQLYQFDEILVDDTKSATKIKKEDYLEIGEYPIIDQGQSVIAGYTANDDGVYDNNEVIIFGDHTRAIKYADFPLFLGADGVKLLKARYDKSKLSMKYVYYFLRTIDLPSDGYSRHFKYLKQVIIPVPSIEVQRRIVKILDAMNEVMNKRKEQIQACDELIKSQFIEMFGDLVSNSKEWKQEILDKHLEVIGGYAFKSDKFVEEGIPVLKIGNINSGYFKDTNLMYWIEDVQLQRYAIYPGDLVISLTGTVGKDDYGNVCIMGADFPMYYLNQRNAKLKLGNMLDKYYLTYALKVPGVKRKLTGISRGVRQANISNKDIQNLELPIPPIELQNEFARFVQQVDKLKFGMEQSLKELEDNFNSLMQKAFKGELF